MDCRERTQLLRPGAAQPVRQTHGGGDAATPAWAAAATATARSRLRRHGVPAENIVINEKVYELQVDAVRRVQRWITAVGASTPLRRVCVINVVTKCRH